MGNGHLDARLVLHRLVGLRVAHVVAASWIASVDCLVTRLVMHRLVVLRVARVVVVVSCVAVTDLWWVEVVKVRSDRICVRRLAGTSMSPHSRLARTMARKQQVSPHEPPKEQPSIAGPPSRGDGECARPGKGAANGVVVDARTHGDFPCAWTSMSTMSARCRFQIIFAAGGHG